MGGQEIAEQPLLIDTSVFEGLERVAKGATLDQIAHRLPLEVSFLREGQPIRPVPSERQRAEFLYALCLEYFAQRAVAGEPLTMVAPDMTLAQALIDCHHYFNARSIVVSGQSNRQL